MKYHTSRILEVLPINEYVSDVKLMIMTACALHI